MLQALFFFLVPFRAKKSEIQRGFWQERQAWMAERSKALDSSSSLFGGVGSNPIPSSTFFAFRRRRGRLSVGNAGERGPLV